MILCKIKHENASKCVFLLVWTLYQVILQVFSSKISRKNFTITRRFTIIEHESLHYCETLLYLMERDLFSSKFWVIISNRAEKSKLFRIFPIFLMFFRLSYAKWAFKKAWKIVFNYKKHLLAKFKMLFVSFIYYLQISEKILAIKYLGGLVLSL